MIVLWSPLAEVRAVLSSALRDTPEEWGIHAVIRFSRDIEPTLSLCVCVCVSVSVSVSVSVWRDFFWVIVLCCYKSLISPKPDAGRSLGWKTQERVQFKSKGSLLQESLSWGWWWRGKRINLLFYSVLKLIRWGQNNVWVNIWVLWPS
jgi:hypothetical protein